MTVKQIAWLLIALCVTGCVCESTYAQDTDPGWDELKQYMRDKLEPIKSLGLVDCTAKIRESSSHRIVMQWMRGEFYKWHEYDSRNNDGSPATAVYMERPYEAALAMKEAQVLLSASKRWVTEGYVYSLVSNVEHPWPLPSIRSSDPCCGVIGPTDDRWELPATTGYPFRTVGFLSVDSTDRGTAFVAGPHTAFTAAHNISNGSTFADNFYFYPGQLQDLSSIGAYLGKAFEVEPGLSPIDPNYTGDPGEHDHGAIFFTADFTLPFGFYPPIESGASPSEIVSAGYPNDVSSTWNDPCNGFQDNLEGMWYTSGNVINIDGGLVEHDADATRGQSGSPLWYEHPSLGLRCFGVANGCFSSIIFSEYNYGHRYNLNDLSMLEAWQSYAPDIVAFNADPVSQNAEVGDVVEFSIAIDHGNYGGSFTLLEDEHAEYTIEYVPDCDIAPDETSVTMRVTLEQFIPDGIYLIPIEIDVSDDPLLTSGHGEVSIHVGPADDTTPPDVEYVQPQYEGQQLSGIIDIVVSADDNVAVNHVEFYAGLQFLGGDSIPPYAMSWDATGITGEVLLSAIAYDTAIPPNSTTAYRSVVITEPTYDVSVNFAASPSQVQVNGVDSATLTAIVTDGLGNPVEGVPVSITRQGGTSGVWVDASETTVLPSPNNSPTDSLGRSRAYFRPSVQGQTCQFIATALGESDTAFFQATPPGETDILIGVSQYQIGGGSATYDIIANLTSNGEPIDSGIARFTTTHGTFVDPVQGNPQMAEDEIDTFGEARELLTISSDADVQICVEYTANGSTECQVFSLSITQPQLQQSQFHVAGPESGNHTMLDIGTHYLAALIEGQGLAVWDTRTWEQVQYWDVDDFPSNLQEWEYSYAIAIDDNDSVIILSGNSCTGFFYPQTGNYQVYDNPPHEPDEAIAIDPLGTDWAGVESGGGMYGGDTFNHHSMSAAYLGDICDSVPLPPGTTAIDIAYARRGSEKYGAGTFRRGDDLSGYLEITHGSSFQYCVEPIQINTGARPGGCEWSRDGNLLAVSDGEGALRLFSHEGVLLDVFALPLDEKAGGISWTPDDSFIAVYVDGGELSILDSVTGLEIARCNVGTNDYRNTNSVDWNASGQIVVATWGSSAIHVYAPFDGDLPVVDVASPASDTIVTQPDVTLSGTITDETMLKPGSARWRLNEGVWLSIELDTSGNFSIPVNLPLGINTLEVSGEDIAGHVSGDIVTVEYAIPPAFAITHEGGPVPGVVDFGQVIQNEASAIELFSVTNSGGLPLELDLMLTGEGFSMPDPLLSTLAPGQSDSFVLRLDSNTAPGQKSADITIVHNAGTPVTFDVIGEVIAAAEPCPWDTTSLEGGGPNGEVDVGDFFALLQHWGSCPAAPDPCPWDTTSLEGGEPNGEVDVGDFFALLQNWGPCP
jgi:V8-like Glu-specific endopeptidase